MKTITKSIVLAATLGAALWAGVRSVDSTLGRYASTAPDGPQDPLVRQVRHELLLLPYYGVFDNLSFRIDGSTVTLFGQVTRPTLRSDAETAVKRIEGVSGVINRIETLPLSSLDDRVRMDAYHAIYGHIGLDRYALQAVPPIHIVVCNGRIALEGTVASQADKNLAGIRAESVPGVFQVANHLQVESH